MKATLITTGLAVILFSTTVPAAVPELDVRLITGNTVKASSPLVTSDSTWVLQSSSSQDGPWQTLATLKPSGYQLSVATAPKFLRLSGESESGPAVAVFDTKLGVRKSGSTLAVYPIRPLPPGAWVLEESKNLTNWTAQVTMDNTGWQKNISRSPDNASYRLIKR